MHSRSTLDESTEKEIVKDIFSETFESTGWLRDYVNEKVRYLSEGRDAETTDKIRTFVHRATLAALAVEVSSLAYCTNMEWDEFASHLYRTFESVASKMETEEKAN